MSISRMKALLSVKGYRIFQRPFELNIIGVRSPFTRANHFDDELHVFYKDDAHKWQYRIFRATTDPGTYWLQNPAYPQGTAILAEGQYLNAYAIGLHKGKYEALVQVGSVEVIRDYNRDAVLDFSSPRTEPGAGINIHHARSEGTTVNVDEWSAGCQVLASADDFNTLMQLARIHSERYGNQFTYTLIDLRSLRRIGRLRTLTGGVLAFFGLALLYSLIDEEKTK